MVPHDCLASGEELQNKIIGGKKGVITSPVLEYSKSRLTAILTIAVGNYSAVFAGTASGSLLKVHMTVFCILA